VDLKLDHHSKDGIEIVDVEGEIDVYTAPRLRELLIDLVNNGFWRRSSSSTRPAWASWSAGSSGSGRTTARWTWCARRSGS
jgi:hypothetical protein